MKPPRLAALDSLSNLWPKAIASSDGCFLLRCASPPRRPPLASEKDLPIVVAAKLGKVVLVPVASVPLLEGKTVLNLHKLQTPGPPTEPRNPETPKVH